MIIRVHDLAGTHSEKEVFSSRPLFEGFLLDRTYETDTRRPTTTLPTQANSLPSELRVFLKELSTLWLLHKIHSFERKILIHCTYIS